MHLIMIGKEFDPMITKATKFADVLGKAGYEEQAGLLSDASSDAKDGHIELFPFINRLVANVRSLSREKAIELSRTTGKLTSDSFGPEGGIQKEARLSTVKPALEEFFEQLRVSTEALLDKCTGVFSQHEIL